MCLPMIATPLITLTRCPSCGPQQSVCSLLTTLVGASACTGLVHESFDQNSYFSYTRPW